MIENPLAPKPIDVKRAEHLKEGVKPIMACVGAGTLEDFEEGAPNESTPKIHNVDFYGDPEELQKKGIENGGGYSYVISAVDNFSKYSKEFYNCTGLIVAGIQKGTGDNVSFMTHQNPTYFLDELDGNEPKNFTDDLIKQLQTIKDRCESGTIDAVIFGGSYAKVKEIKEPDPKRNMYIEEYLESIQFLSQKVKDELGFEPLVITGPKTVPAADCIFYDNDMRRLYLFRGSGDFDAIQSFTPSELEERRKTWKPGEWGLPI